MLAYLSDAIAFSSVISRRENILTKTKKKKKFHKEGWKVFIWFWRMRKVFWSQMLMTTVDWWWWRTFTLFCTCSLQFLSILQSCCYCLIIFFPNIGQKFVCYLSSCNSMMMKIEGKVIWNIFFLWSLQIFSTWLIDNQSRKKILSRNVDCDWTSLAPLLFIHYSNSQSELMNTKKSCFQTPPGKERKEKTFLLRLEFTFSISNLSKSRTVFREVKRIRNGKHFPIQ